jgi:hypothetical protein
MADGRVLPRLQQLVLVALAHPAGAALAPPLVGGEQMSIP